ncbi:MAG: exopolysaccharide biosynthesis protein [Hyphomonadaceae bacterium]|nr:exopolysaccharide biosynthesis protein [Hyphomonadaceae bacterium]
MDDDAPATVNGVLDEIEQTSDGGGSAPVPPTMTLGEMLETVGRRSYGPLLLAIGLFAISPATVLPGMTWFAAALTLIVAGQMALGLPRIWLPQWALRMKLPRRAVRDGVNQSRGWARVVDALLRQRLAFMARPPFVNLIAVLCILAALVTFPLGLIPLAPLIPGAAVVFFGLGLMGRDGLWLSLGIAVLTGAFWLAKPLVLALL